MLTHEIRRRGAGHFDCPTTIDLARKSAFAMEERYFILFEQIQNAVVVLFDDIIFTTDHFVELQGHALDFNAVLGKVVVRLFKMLGRLQQRLGRNTAHVSAGATRSGTALTVLPCINTRDRHTQLCGANRGDIATWSCTNNDYIKLI